MGKKKIIFISSSLTDNHFRNRIKEFLDNGYEVEAYGFERKSHTPKVAEGYTQHFLGYIENVNYCQRLLLYKRTFSEIRKKYKSENSLFYINGLDVAIFFCLFHPKIRYIYEECDLVHTYTGELKYIFEYLDKKIIKKSLLSIFTSRGFVEYHFGDKIPNNITVVENKLTPSIVNQQIQHRLFVKDQLSIGFVGWPRFDSIYSFIDKYCKAYPNYTLHVFGGPVSTQFKELDKYSNCHFHGFFNNPDDLPSIYSKIDIVLATYDPKYENVKYAEPNKLYESIYFETPILVTKGTFLEKKTKEMGIGFSVDPFDENEIKRFVEALDVNNYNKIVNNIRKIDKKEALNINMHLFKKLEHII